MKSLFRILVLTCAAMVALLPARAVTVNITYDASVTNSGFLPQVQTALGVVTNTYHVLFTNSSTVNVICYWGDVGPFIDDDVDVSASSFPEVGTFTYAQITNALRAVRISANDSNAVASLPTSDPIATNKWWVPRAEVKVLPSLAAIAQISSTDTINDGAISFGRVPYTFNPTNRAVPGKYDFIAAAEHEISEIMGRTYELNQYDDGVYIPYDLFRFTNSGVRCFDLDATNVYFSVNKGTNNLKMFYEEYYLDPSADACDWQSSGQTDAYDALFGSGVIDALSPLDLVAMDIVGYHTPAFSPSRLAGAWLANGTFQLSFTNISGAQFSVYASSDVTQNPTNWVYLGLPVESPAGHYQFIDGPATPSPSRFYRVRLP